MRRKKFSDFFYVGHKYKAEVRKQIRMFIIFTLAFTIAFTWRETFFDLSREFMIWLTGAEDQGTASIFASIFITLVSVLLIFLTSQYFKEKHNKY